MLQKSKSSQGNQDTNVGKRKGINSKSQRQQSFRNLKLMSELDTESLLKENITHPPKKTNQPKNLTNQPDKQNPPACSRRLEGKCEQDVNCSTSKRLRLDGESEVKTAAWEQSLGGLWLNLLLRHKKRKETWPENWWVC